MSDNKEKYWVGGSDGESLEKLYFNEIDAFVSGHTFLDAFDESGEFVACYKFVDDEYTLDW